MMNTEDLKNISAAYLEVVTEKNKESNEKHKALMKKADEDASNDKSDDGDGMDKVDPKASKKKFADRKDKDVDNDGDVDASDKFLHKRRKAIGKAMAKDDEKEESKTEAKKEEEEVCESCGKVHEGDCDPADVKEFKLKKEMKKKKLKADDENPADADSKDADEDEVEEGKRGFIAAAKAAKDAGEKSFVFAGKKYNCEDMKEITKESVKKEATFDTDYFTGYKHAKKAGMKVKTTAKGADGDNVTISHSDSKKLQKYVDNHLGGGKIKEAAGIPHKYTVDLYNKDHGSHSSFIKKAQSAGIKGVYSGVNSDGKVKVSLNHHDNSDGGTIHKFLKKHYDKDMTHGNMQTMKTGSSSQKEGTMNEEYSKTNKASMTIKHGYDEGDGPDNKKFAKHISKNTGATVKHHKDGSTMSFHGSDHQIHKALQIHHSDDKKGLGDLNYHKKGMTHSDDHVDGQHTYKKEK